MDKNPGNRCDVADQLQKVSVARNGGGMRFQFRFMVGFMYRKNFQNFPRLNVLSLLLECSNIVHNTYGLLRHNVRAIAPCPT